MKLIGLTGGIASGKSFIESMLKRAGIPVIDADELSRRVTAPNSIGLSQVITHFGEVYLKDDGTLDRKALAQLVFSNERAKLSLEKIVHPLIHEAMQIALDELKKQGHAYAVYCAALIFEKNLQDRFDAIILVDCDEASQMSRLMQRDNLTKSEAQLRLQSQLPLKHKKELTAFWVDNTGTKSQCAQSLSKVWKSITNQTILFKP